MKFRGKSSLHEINTKHSNLKKIKRYRKVKREIVVPTLGSGISY